jgi:hypothetical protein
MDWGGAEVARLEPDLTYMSQMESDRQAIPAVHFFMVTIPCFGEECPQLFCGCWCSLHGRKTASIYISPRGTEDYSPLFISDHTK